MLTQTENGLNRLLVIDDNEAIHRDFQKIFDALDHSSELDELTAELFDDYEAGTKFQAKQFQLSCASQGQEGLALLRQAVTSGDAFAVAFVDMRMPPGWDGVETIERLWEVDPDLQVVICTAYSDRSWEEIIGRLGPSDRLLILKKPFDEVEVMQLANSLSRKRELLEQSRSRMQYLEDEVEEKATQLQTAHRNADKLIDSLNSAIVCVDETGIVDRWNPVAARLFGISVDDVVGRPLKELPIQWDDWELVADAVAQCFAGEQKNLEIKYVDPEDMPRTLDFNVSPIIDGNAKACLISASDVTRQRALQIQLDQALRLESVGQLAAGVAHEINTPMQYIGDNVRYVSKSIEKLDEVFDQLRLLTEENLEDDRLRDIHRTIASSKKGKKFESSLTQIKEALDDSINGVEAVAKIVAAMKEFSHPGSEQKSMVCVNHILESTLTVAKNEWKYVADVEVDFDERLSPIEGLPSELNQAFLNIVVNAAHAIGDRVAEGRFAKGKINISTEDSADSVFIRITDTGGGIPEDIRTKVFEPFFTTKDVGKGTGQGLSIAYAVIVKKHGGKLQLAVDEGTGTTFIIELPKIAPACNQPIHAKSGDTQ